MEIKNKTVFHISRHKNLAHILKEGGIFHTNDFILESYNPNSKNQKEISAEEARIKIDPNLPKRTESMHICLEKDLGKWRKLISTAQWYRILKLNVTGKVFWGDSCEYNEANYEKYWKGCDPNSLEGQIEGLFQGEYQIIEIIEKRG